MGWDEEKAERAQAAFALPRREMDAAARSFQGEIGQGKKARLNFCQLTSAFPRGKRPANF